MIALLAQSGTIGIQGGSSVAGNLLTIFLHFLTHAQEENIYEKQLNRKKKLSEISSGITVSETTNTLKNISQMIKKIDEELHKLTKVTPPDEKNRTNKL